MPPNPTSPSPEIIMPSVTDILDTMDYGTAPESNAHAVEWLKAHEKGFGHFINGTIVGPVHAGEYAELQAKANVTGDVYYRTLEIQLGAVVQGRLVYQPEGKSDKVVQLKPATAD